MPNEKDFERGQRREGLHTILGLEMKEQKTGMVVYNSEFRGGIRTGRAQKMELLCSI